MTLYKYTSIEYIQSCIENGVFASRLDNINDPFENSGISYPEQFRVVCLTGSAFKMLMWAYYGNHKICCVEFEVPDNVGICKVDYVQEFVSREDMSTDEVIESLYKKGNEWKHENEYRLVYHEGTAQKGIWKKEGDNIFLIAPVKRVIFGLSAVMNYKYVEALEYLKNYNATHAPEIIVTKCKQKNGTYQLDADKQFDLDAEIKIAKAYKGKKYQIGEAEIWGGKCEV